MSRFDCEGHLLDLIFWRPMIQYVLQALESCLVFTPLSLLERVRRSVLRICENVRVSRRSSSGSRAALAARIC